MPDPRPQPFGFLNLGLGMNSGLDPDLIEDNQGWLLVNMTVRSGKPETRPGWGRIAFSGDDLSEGRFQGAAIYQSTSGENFIVASIGGRQYRIDTEGTVLDITIAGSVNNPNRPQVWWAQADKYLIMQDGQGAPWVWDGSSAFRLGPGQLPCGTVMAYGMGRVWIASVDRKSFVAGDLIYGDGTVASVLRFTENTFLNEGGAFAIPFTSGRINAMQFLANTDTSLGQGPLQVFCDVGVFSVNAPVDREVWKDVTYPIQTFSLLSSGAVAQDSTVLVNNDIWCRSVDGLRSLKVARRDFQDDWGNTPMSREMDYVLGADTGFLLWASKGALFDNRLFFTCSPVEGARGVMHRGLTVMDFHQTSSLSGKRPSVYDGVWTGLNILQILSGTFGGQERCFIFALNSDDELELWELSKRDYFDNTDQRIESRAILKSFDGGAPTQYKMLRDAQLWPEDEAGEVEYDLYWRSDAYPCWQQWDTKTHCSRVTNCGELVDGCLAPTMFRAHPGQMIVFREAPGGNDTCQEPLNKLARAGWEFQPMLVITGHTKVKQFLCEWQAIAPPVGNGCPTPTECTEVECCDAEVFSYQTSA